MVFIGRCIACQFGRHDEHYEVIRQAPPGVMGGAVCGCKGDCGVDPQVRIDEMVAELEGHYQEGAA